MPNWCYNKMKFRKKDFPKFLERYVVPSEGDEKKREFDFNKVAPMPKELADTISSGSNADLIVYYLFSTMKKKDAFAELEKYRKCSRFLIWTIGSVYNRRMTVKQILDKARDRIGEDKDIRIFESELYDDKLKKKYKDGSYRMLDAGHTAEEAGKYYYELLVKFGCMDWYEWACKNWGVKWNASDTYIDDEKCTIWFDTPWGTPEGIYEKIAKQNPDWNVRVRADFEDPGHITGRIVNGELEWAC